MKTRLTVVTIAFAAMFLGCAGKSSAGQPVVSSAPVTAQAQPAQPVQPAQPISPAAPGPNLSINIGTRFLFDILDGLCKTAYQIYLGSSDNWIIFRELKHVQNIPAAGEVELAMRLDFCVKKLGMKYQDTAEATVRLKLSTVKKGDKIMLVGGGKVVAIKTRFGPTLDESFLMPAINKEMTKAPLFELPFSDIAHVFVPWPKLGDAPRSTELSLSDASVEIKQTFVVFHLLLKAVTTVPK